MLFTSPEQISAIHLRNVKAGSFNAKHTFSLCSVIYDSTWIVALALVILIYIAFDNNFTSLWYTNKKRRTTQLKIITMYSV